MGQSAKLYVAASVKFSLSLLIYETKTVTKKTMINIGKDALMVFLKDFLITAISHLNHRRVLPNNDTSFKSFIGGFCIHGHAIL